MRIHPADLGILILYLAGVTLLGAWFRRGQKDVRDYFLGGKTAPAWALACSIVATETSTLTIIGTPAIAFGGNLGFLQLVIGYLVARVILCVVFVPRYFQGEFYTAYQLLEKRFGVRVKSAGAGVFLVTRALAEGVRIAAVGKVVSVALGTGSRTAILIVTVLTLFYTFEGGLKAVIWTDVMQLAIYLTGSAVAFWLLLHKIPGGWSEVTQVAAAAGGKLRVFDFSLSLTQSYTFWSGVIGGTFLTVASHGTDQTLVQRVLAARNERDGKVALLGSGVIVLIQFALFLVIGVMLFVFYQHAAPGVVPLDRDQIFPTFIVSEMPPGIAGLVLAAILAVAMSNASGSLNSLASSSIMDFGAGASGGAQPSPGELLKRSRWMTLIWGIVLGSLGLVHWGPVLVAGLTITSITYGAMLGVFLLGIWNPRANSTGAIVGMLFGLGAMLAVHRFTMLAWTWYVLVGTVVTFAAGSIASAIVGGGLNSEVRSAEAGGVSG
ncbi:MAG: sodium:solute symporter [Candidatus Acidiferrales bacterium]